MINSLMSRMGEAQKLSVPQLQKAIQDGTLPPYIGIPLLQDKMKQAQMAKASMQAPKEPPIAEQVMQEASMHDRGVEQLPSNLPTEEMAGGGIVAFAGEDGSLVDDESLEDYNDALEEAEDEKTLAQAQANQEDIIAHGITSLPQAENKGTGISFKEPIPSGASKGIDADMARKHNVGNLRPTGFKYEGQIGVSPGGFAMFESREAGINALNHDIGVKLNRGLNTPEKFLNVYAPKSDKNDTEAYIQSVSKSLGIKPNQEIPNTPEAKMILAQAITRQEGAEKATARFNEGGIIGLAQGGGVKYYGDPVKNPNEDQLIDTNQGINTAPALPDLTPKAPTEPVSDIIDPMSGDVIRIPKRVLGGSPAKKAAESKNLQPGLTYDEMVAGSSRAGTEAALNKDTTSGLPALVSSSTGSTTASAPTDEYTSLMKQYGIDPEERKKQKSIDGYMGLLTAGLGMMGGTSPYALTNIGQGALAGVKQYADSRKQAAAENAAEFKNVIALKRAQESSKANVATQARLDQAQKSALMDRAYQAAVANATKRAETAMIVDPAKKEEFINRLVSTDPEYNRLRSLNGYNAGSAPANRFDPSLFQIQKS